MSAENTPKLANDITCAELKNHMDRGDNIVLLDVRNPDEYDFCKIAGSTLMPLNELPTRFKELSKDSAIVAQCRSGGRSAKAAAFLREQGFPNVANLTGGILAWSDQVDPSIPKY